MYAEYWGVILVVAALVIYYISAKNHTIIRILQYMLFIEKKASSYGMNVGSQKFQWVANKYDNLPVIVRAVITKELYEMLIQELYDKTISGGNSPFDI
jgi:hypothetical protein